MGHVAAPMRIVNFSIKPINLRRYGLTEGDQIRHANTRDRDVSSESTMPPSQKAGPQHPEFLGPRIHALQSRYEK